LLKRWRYDGTTLSWKDAIGSKQYTAVGELNRANAPLKNIAAVRKKEKRKKSILSSEIVTNEYMYYFTCSAKANEGNVFKCSAKSICDKSPK